MNIEETKMTDVQAAVWAQTHSVNWIDSTYHASVPEPISYSDRQIVSHWLWQWHDSSSRLGALLDVADMGEMEPEDWFALLGDCWSSFDNVGQYNDELYSAIMEMALDPHGTIPKLMTRWERYVFNRLPDEITIYRGCGPRNMHGYSWSLSREIAQEFPYKSRYQTPEPLLFTITIPKTRVAAIKLGRREREVIVFDCPWEPQLIWEKEQLPPRYLI